MHLTNRQFWEYCVNKYSSYFVNSSNKILEVGSYNVNGSVRDYFTAYDKYVGVDWRPGPCVDVVSLAHEMKFPFKFNTIISASMLEHDRHWDKSLVKMIELMEDNGILLLSWGGALNPPHEHDTADDGCFHALPAGRVIKFLESLGMYIHEFRYEGVQFRDTIKKIFKRKKKTYTPLSGMGEVCLVAFKDERFKIGERVLDPLLKEDEN